MTSSEVSESLETRLFKVCSMNVKVSLTPRFQWSSRGMGSWIRFFRSSIGKKFIMGLTGLVWVGFVFTHMAANMLILLGDGGEAYNLYSHAITSNKPLLYGA